MTNLSEKAVKSILTSPGRSGDHPPPKRAMTAWTVYNSEQSRRLAKEGRRKEAFRLASESWKSCTEEEKAPYVKLAEIDRRRE